MSENVKKPMNIGQLSLVIFFVSLVILFLAGGYAFLREKNYADDLNVLYRVELKTQQWLTDYRKANDDLDNEKIQELIIQLNDLLPQLDSLVARPYPYIKQIAMFNKGMIYAVQGDDVNGALIFETLFHHYRKSLLGAKAGLNAAAAYENIGDDAKALLLYKKVAAKKKVSNFWEEASFHVARVTETEDKILAIELYRDLVNQLEDGNFWRTLSKNRALTLETQQ